MPSWLKYHYNALQPQSLQRFSQHVPFHNDKKNDKSTNNYLLSSFLLFSSVIDHFQHGPVESHASPGATWKRNNSEFVAQKLPQRVGIIGRKRNSRPDKTRVAKYAQLWVEWRGRSSTLLEEVAGACISTDMWVSLLCEFVSVFFFFQFFFFAPAAAAATVRPCFKNSSMYVRMYTYLNWNRVCFPVLKHRWRGGGGGGVNRVCIFKDGSRWRGCGRIAQRVWGSKDVGIWICASRSGVCLWPLIVIFGTK